VRQISGGKEIESDITYGGQTSSRNFSTKNVCPPFIAIRNSCFIRETEDGINLQLWEMYVVSPNSLPSPFNIRRNNNNKSFSKD